MQSYLMLIRLLKFKKILVPLYLWLKKFKGKDIEYWVKIFKRNFKFTGPEITKEFLISTAFVEGAHKKLPLL